MKILQARPILSAALLALAACQGSPNPGILPPVRLLDATSGNTADGGLSQRPDGGNGPDGMPILPGNPDAMADDSGTSQDDAGTDVDADMTNPDATPDFPDAMPVFPDATPVFPDAETFPDAMPRPDGGFMVAAHAPLTNVPNQGGARLTHPQLVLISFADEPNRATLEAHAQWLVGSTWLQTVGAEYGVTGGSVMATVHSSSTAPSMVMDGDVQNFLVTGLQNHTIPTPAGGSFANVLYVVYYPQHTTVLLPAGGGQSAQSCQDFGGYHAEVDQPGMTFSYAVIPNCPGFAPGLTDVEGEEIAVSHEVMEAATDALPYTAPAFALPQNSPSPWVIVGGEIGDLCALPLQVYREGMFVAQRLWSDQAAAANTRDPCIPADPARPYYQTVPQQTDIQGVAAGQTLTLELHGFSTAPLGNWQIQAQVQATMGFNPTVNLSTHTMNNGQIANLTVTVPAGTQPQNYAVIYLLSAFSMSDYHLWPIIVVVQ